MFGTIDMYGALDGAPPKGQYYPMIEVVRRWAYVVVDRRIGKVIVMIGWILPWVFWCWIWVGCMLEMVALVSDWAARGACYIGGVRSSLCRLMLRSVKMPSGCWRVAIIPPPTN